MTRAAPPQEIDAIFGILVRAHLASEHDNVWRRDYKFPWDDPAFSRRMLALGESTPPGDRIHSRRRLARS